MDMNKFNFIKNLWLRLILLILLIAALALFFMSIIQRKPILIGFVTQLTGRQAELGVQQRNGVQLAVEELNALGGISGRKIELIIRDDFGLPMKAKSADSELIKSNVVAIIGHATSEQTMAGLEVTNPAKVLLIGPTVSTPKLDDLDDYFFRAYPSFKKSSQAFAQYIYKRIDISNLAIILDIDNAAYSKTYSITFANKFHSLGGNIVKTVSFSSVTQPNFYPLLIQLKKSNAEGLLIIASDIDTALIAQKARLMDWKVPIFTSGWSATENLINNGGKAVEEILFKQVYDLTNHSPGFIDFQSRYKARYGNNPSFGAVLAYDAMMVLAEALKKTEGKSNGLRQALLEIQDFPGLMSPFSFNQFGDVERPFYLSTIRNGKFIIIDKLDLTELEVIE